MRRFYFGLWAALLCAHSISLLAAAPAGGEDRSDPRWLLPAPQLQADPKTPTLKQIVGHGWGEDITSYSEMERYVQALAEAAPDHVRLVPYGESYEGRTLYYLIISSPQNLRRSEEIRVKNLLLADPRRTPPERARELAAESPALVWLAHNTHGNETSSTEAAMLTAYHLAADRSATTKKLLEDVVVFIDPVQNPDGRQRFVNVFRETRGVFAESDPLASEHTERWPGGRSNHYLFDMNRDWFLQSQREMQGKVAAYLRWQPQIYVDAHEMGRNNTYYFVPPMDPVNPFVLPRQSEWFDRLGRHQAKRFDEYGFSYTTREMFDAFYPGYGSQWPTLQGGIGVLWEQAGVRGVVIDRDDETKLHYHDAVRHHYISSLATIEIAAQRRGQLLMDFYETRQRGVQLGREGPVRHYFLFAARRPHYGARLAQLLLNNGIDVLRVTNSLSVTCTDISTGVKQRSTIPAGSYHVPVAQPAGRLIRALLDRHVDMGQEFVERQLRRKKERFPDEIYDVTAWSLPMAFDVKCLATGEAAEVESELWDGAPLGGELVGEQAKVAYLTAGGDGAMRALAAWLRDGLRVHVADRALRLDGVDFPRGSLILKTHDNPARLHAAMKRSAQEFQLEIHAADSGFVSEGAHLGGPHVKWVRPPKVVLLVNRPASYSVGHTWYLFDQRMGYPVTRVAGRDLSRLELHPYNVLVLPDGSYSGGGVLGETEIARIKQWVGQGGTLILVKGAAAWATDKKVGLLAGQLQRKPVQPKSKASDEAAGKESPSDSGGADATESPDAVPGVFLRADVFQEHWVTFGCPETLDVFFRGNLILSSPPPNKGRSLVTFQEDKKVLVSGFCWPKTLELIEGAPYVVHQPLGKGHVVAFMDDPNFRAMYPSLQRFFVNAVMFGPGH